MTKKTSRNQVTGPKKVVPQPVELDPLAAAQRKLEELGIAQADLERAVAWARANS